ncbi:hypothetical protein E4T56_gene6798 [Termitomyces sp. T112]|nr:hypothetical protein E4T56_gene6798 [Termitomyces sp. T112]
MPQSPVMVDMQLRVTFDAETPASDNFTTKEEKMTATPEEQSCLKRKFDFFILPPLTIMYLCNALDKGNVGNAKTDGWDKDIGLTGNQLNLSVLCTRDDILCSLLPLRHPDLSSRQAFLSSTGLATDDDRFWIHGTLCWTCKELLADFCHLVLFRNL